MLYCSHTLTAAAQTAPSVFELLDGSGYRIVELSPDGERAAYIFATPAKYCVDRFGQIKPDKVDRCKESDLVYRAKYKFGVVEVDGGEMNEVNSVDLPDDVFVSWIEWASNDRILASLVRRSTFNKKTGRRAVGGSRILSFDRDFKNFATLFQGEKNVNRNDRFISSITDFLPNDPDHVVIPASDGVRLDLWKVNITTGKAELLAEGTVDTTLWFTDRQGAPYIRYDQKGSSILIFAWSKEKQDWENVTQFKIRKRWTGEDQLDFFPVAQTDDPNRLIVVTDEEDDARRAIKIFDFKEKDYVETIFEHPEVDVANAMIDPRTREYIGARFYVDRLQHDFVDKKTQAHYKAMNKFFNNEYNVSVQSIDENRKYSIIRVSSPSDPGGFYLYDYENPSVTPLYPRKPSLLDFTFGESDILRVPVRDGRIITAYHTHPSTGKDGNAPLIVMPHGGPESRDYYDYDPTVQFLTTRGYQVLQVNFRGSSGYGTEFAKAGYREWGLAMQDDITDSVLYLHNNDLAPSDRTCIVGASYGGYAALVGATKTPELYKCVVSVAGVSDLLAILDYYKKRTKSFSETYKYWQKSIGSAGDDTDKLRAASPANYAENVTAPVLLVHGEYDGIVNVEQSEKMNSALKRAGADVEFIKLQNEGHSGWSLQTEQLYHDKLEAFLAEHLQ